MRAKLCALDTTLFFTAWTEETFKKDKAKGLMIAIIIYQVHHIISMASKSATDAEDAVFYRESLIVWFWDPEKPY